MIEGQERIYGWQQSQLSVARFYGGCRIGGHHYTIAYSEQGTPLVRWDVLKREAKERKEIEKQNRLAARQTQGVLI